MVPAELALRIATAAILLLTGIVMLRDRRRLQSGPFGGLLCVSVALYAVLPVAGRLAFSSLWPLHLVAMGTPALLWIWAGAVFVDEFRPSWRDALAWLVLPVVDAIAYYIWRPWIGTAENALAMLFVLLTAWRIVAGLRGDLVERRRRLRPVLAILAVLYAVGTIVLDVLGGERAADAPSRILESAALSGLAAAFALLALRAGQPLSGPAPVDLRPVDLRPVDRPPGETAGRAPTPFAGGEQATDPQCADVGDDALLARLRRLMEEDKVYRQDGFGLGTLVAALDVPEYRLRRLINQRLGHRNFSSFTNGYRLAEVTAALGDSSQAGVPVLTIALDAGFQSIGPFNRAFKAHTGMTPTEFRRQADSRKADFRGGWPT
ncbi:helix-turn-helix domain-containing protein [soil metagenome]